MTPSSAAGSGSGSESVCRNRARLRRDLERLVDDVEAIDWRHVPGVDVQEAAAVATKLQHAADRVEARR
jgi:cell division FtsZ-interacting protein ZapD